jgi:MFS family permease
VAPALQRRFKLRTLTRLICWTAAALLAVSAILPMSILAAVPLGMAVFLGPACNATLFGFQAAITPGRLQGRVVSVIMVAATSIAAAAPTVAGFILANTGASTAIFFFAAAVAGSALVATCGRGIRELRETELIEEADEEIALHQPSS